MSEAEVTLNHRERPVSVLHYLLLIISPVLALFVFVAFINLFVVGVGDLGKLSVVLFVLCSLPAVLILGLSVTSDTSVFLTRYGIRLPFFMAPRLGFVRSQHHWSELTNVQFLPRGKRGVLLLAFEDRSRVRFNLDFLPAAKVDEMLVAIDIWAGQSQPGNFPALLEARSHLKELDDGLEPVRYTQLWEDELTRRFGPTNFIPLEAGHVVRGFTVQRQLAFGGLSALYVVKDHDSHQFVLKEAVIPPDADASMRHAAEQMLNREATILASLSHPNIAKVIDHFVEAGRHYMLMELITGEDLRRLVQEFGPQIEGDVIAWSIQIAEILSYLHTQTPPVIHRDLSPDNIMLRENGQICLVDFGAANHFVGAATGTLIGKQAYIAPEQLRGKAEPRSDIYAFGCTMFYLLTGKDSEPLSVAQLIMSNPAVSSEMDDMIAKCTQQEPEDRPHDAAKIISRLHQLAASIKNA